MTIKTLNYIPAKIDPTPQFEGNDPSPINVGICIEIAKRPIRDLSYLMSEEKAFYNRYKCLIVKIKMEPLKLDEQGVVRKLNILDRKIEIRKMIREAAMQFFSQSIADLEDKILASCHKFSIKTLVTMRLVCKKWANYVDEKILPDRGSDIVKTVTERGTSYSSFLKNNKVEILKIGQTLLKLAVAFRFGSKFWGNGELIAGNMECSYEETDSNTGVLLNFIGAGSSFLSSISELSSVPAFWAENRSKISTFQKLTKVNILEGTTDKLSVALSPQFFKWKLRKMISNNLPPLYWEQNKKINEYQDESGSFILFPSRDKKGNLYDYGRERGRIEKGSSHLNNIEELKIDIPSFYKIQEEIRK